MRIDLRFVDLEYELAVQRDYIQMLETHLPAIVEAERARMYALYDGVPEDERFGIEFLEHDLDRGIPTRSFFGASVVGVWATYETSVSAVAEVGRAAVRATLRLDDLRGDFMERARRYYGDVLRMDLARENGDWPTLCDLAAVRNLVAHASGRTGHLSPAKKTRVRTLVDRTAGLWMADDVLIITAEAARTFHGAVERSLQDLFTRARIRF